MDNVDRENSVFGVLVGSNERDRQLVQDVFRNFGWRLFEAQDRQRTLQYLDSYPVQVVIAEAGLPHWSWKTILRDLRQREPAPHLIVTSHHADDYLWAEALNLGAYDVLAQPFERDEVERVVTSAGRRHLYREPKTAGLRASVSAARIVA